jgi:uracil-DNA glycosylase
VKFESGFREDDFSGPAGFVLGFASLRNLLYKNPIMPASKIDSFPDSLPAEWRKRLGPEANAEYFSALGRFLASEYKTRKEIYPEKKWILRALQLVDFDDVRVVILGQDPYHGVEQAIGLSFGVPNELQPKPPSLVNIFKELELDLGVAFPRDRSDLTGWARQGVLLLNAVLTVRRAEAFSHRDQGWDRFTDRVVEQLGKRKKPVVFILWGVAAQKKKALIDLSKHFILESPHPSPLSASKGFFGSRPFSKTNKLLLEKLGQDPIDWTRISISD